MISSIQALSASFFSWLQHNSTSNRVGHIAIGAILLVSAAILIYKCATRIHGHFKAKAATPETIITKVERLKSLMQETEQSLSSLLAEMKKLTTSEKKATVVEYTGSGD